MCVPPARPAGTGGPARPQRGQDIPRLGGFRERRNVRTLLIGNRGPLSEGLVCLGWAGRGGSGEAVIEARVGEITGNIWLAFYRRFLIKWPLVCVEAGGGRQGGPGEAGGSHRWWRAAGAGTPAGTHRYVGGHGVQGAKPWLWMRTWTRGAGVFLWVPHQPRGCAALVTPALSLCIPPPRASTEICVFPWGFLLLKPSAWPEALEVGLAAGRRVAGEKKLPNLSQTALFPQ